MRRVSDPGPVNLAFGERTSLLSLIAELEAILDHPLERQHVQARVGDVRESQADNTRLRNLFPAASAVPFRDGLEATLAWNKNELNHS
jgi:UDP-glucose 4-epimerase